MCDILLYNNKNTLRIMDIFDSVILLYFYEYLLSVKRKNCMHKNRTNKRNI